MAYLVIGAAVGQFTIHCTTFVNFQYCKFRNIREGFIFAKLRTYAKFRENKILARWRNHSVFY